MASVQRRIAPAPLTSPLPRPQRGSGRRLGGWCGQPSPPAPLPRCGRGGSWFVNAAALTDAGSPLLRSPPPFLAHSVGAEGGWGDGEGGHHFLSPILPLITPSATFSNQTNLVDLHRFINRFAHVIDGKRRNAYRRQCFHLDTSLALAAYRCLNL